MRQLNVLCVFFACIFILVSLSSVTITTHSALAADAYNGKVELREGVFVITRQGQSYTLSRDMFPPLSVRGAALSYLAIGHEEAMKYGLHGGVYIFEMVGGAPLAFAATEMAEYCSGVFLSPDKKILAMDAGTYFIRELLFFSYPNARYLGKTTYYSDGIGYPLFLWIDESKGILVSQLSEDSKGRQCDYDPCGPISVVHYSFADKKETKVQEGSALCDYRLDRVKGHMVELVSVCLPNVEAWRMYQTDPPVQSVTVPLP